MKNLVYILFFYLMLLFSPLAELKSRPSPQKTIDSLQKELAKSQKDDTTTVRILTKIASKYYFVNPNLGLKYGRKALAQAQKINFKLGIAVAHNAIAKNYWILVNYSETLKNLIYALDIYNEIGDSSGIANIRGNIGLIYSLSNLDARGLKHLEFACGEGFKFLDHIGQLRNLVNMANAYRRLKNYDKSIEYFNKAKKLAEVYKNTNFNFQIYLNLEILYAEMHQYDKALLNLYLAKKELENFGTDIDLKKLWDSQYSAVILGYFLDTNSNKVIIKELEQNKKKFLVEIQAKLQSSMIFNKSIKAISDIMVTYNNYSMYFVIQNKFDSAYHYHYKYSVLKDSLQASNDVAKLGIIEVVRELAAKKNQIELESEYNSWYRWISVVLFVLSVLLVIGLYYLVKTLNRNKILNLTLNEKNKEIVNSNIELEILVSELSEKQIEISETNDKLNTANIAKDKLFSIISHDLRSPFTGIIGLSDLLANDYDRIPKNEIQSISKSINTASKNTYEMLNGLLDWAKTQLGSISYIPVNCSPKSILESIMPNFINLASAKEIELNNDINRDISIYCDYAMLSTIFRNLISNAIKYSIQGGKITITAISDGKAVQFSVNDTGVGIPDSVINDLFKLDKHISTKGTKNEPGSGLGLLLCKDFIDMHNGRIWVESEIGKGTTFIFTLPAANPEQEAV